MTLVFLDVSYTFHGMAGGQSLVTDNLDPEGKTILVMHGEDYVFNTDCDAYVLTRNGFLRLYGKL